VNELQYSLFITIPGFSRHSGTILEGYTAIMIAYLSSDPENPKKLTDEKFGKS